jgi:endo-1,4-beta-xylanase
MRMHIKFAYNKVAFKFCFFSIILILICIACSSNSKKPRLKDVYKDAFYIGTALDSTQIYGGDPKALAIFKEQFNAVTAENVTKWEKIHPKPNEYNFKPADRFVELGEKYQMYIVGHVLVWHQQTPRWVFQDKGGNLVDRETLLHRMREHIHTVVGRYKGRIDSWDVVNEAIDENGEWRKNIWYQIIGKDYVQKAFEYAREADPGAKLIYNDHSLPNPEKRDGVIKMVRELQSKGVKIDEIGMQGHYLLYYPGLDTLEECIVAFSELGVNIALTEMEVSVLPFPTEEVSADISLNVELQKKYNPFPDSLPHSMQQKLADRYADFFKIFLKYKDKISRVTIWGIYDGQSWTNNWPIRGRTNYPLLFDRQYQPKVAFDALIKVGQNNR